MKSKADRIKEMEADVARAEAALDKTGAEQYMAAIKLCKARRVLADALKEDRK